MPNTIHCPSCRRELRVPAELVDKKVKCPGCGVIFTASLEPEDAPQPPVVLPEEAAPTEPAEPQLTRPERSEGAYYEGETFDQFTDYERRAYQTDRSQAKDSVMAPATCLLIAAIMGLCADLVQIVYASMVQPPPPAAAGGAPDIFAEIQRGAVGPVAVAFGIVGFVLSAVIIFASIQMMRLRTYGLALAGSILSMINLINCCCLLGLPFGIWAVVVLSKPEVKSAFE